MSIIVAGIMRIDPANAEKAKAAVIKMMRATRQEPGCRFYNISADLEDGGTFHICEEWESEAALASHMQAPHMNEFKIALGGLGVRALDIKRYEASAGQPVSV
ncbi:MAG TPA: putative quinol monooxygenase [Haliangium sp.]|nr:putative quinol monooxygenase [Haliangium sp.]